MSSLGMNTMNEGDLKELIREVSEKVQLLANAVCLSNLSHMRIRWT